MMFYFECGSCPKTFPAGWKAREQHCIATGHGTPKFECATCPRWFGNQSACNQHMNDVNHYPYECALCQETWPTEHDRKDHEVDYHTYCAECDRQFNNLNNIKIAVHRGQTLQCPFCPKSYATATGLTHHVETGSCPNAGHIDRDELYRFVRSKDPDGCMSKNLLGWTGSVVYEANELAWNGNAWECYFCHREFGTHNSLNQHLSSPAHQQALYHCPNRACRMDFRNLGGVINHLESESCGHSRFDTVQRNIRNIVSGDRLIRF